MHCSNFDNFYKGLSIKEVTELADSLEQIADGKPEWITIYKCKICGQLWKEFYTPTGHGEIPNITKIDKWPEYLKIHS